jgi:KRAB domain-containing zinc finger protein
MEHMQNRHLPKTKFICDQCDFRTAISGNYNIHVLRDHLKKFDFKCKECEKEFVTIGMLNGHIKKHHLGIIPTNTGFKCPYCLKVKNSRNVLKEHINVVHKMFLKTLPCQLCDRICHSEHTLKLHIKQVHTSGIHQCDFEGCEKVFKSAKLVRRHVRRTHLKSDPKYICEVCSRAVATSQLLEMHMNSIHLNLKYYCVYPGCELEYKRKNNLREHLLKHHTKDPEEIKTYYKLINLQKPHKTTQDEIKQ